MNLPVISLRFTARRALVLALVAIVFLPFLTLTVFANTPTPDRDYFLVYRADNGDAVCRQANVSERRELETITPRDLRQINHLDTINKGGGFSAQADNALPGHLTIILRATTNLENNAPAKAAFVRAAAAWENLVSTPVTIYVDVDYGPDNFGQAWPSGVLASTSSPSLGSVSYNLLRTTLISGANSAAKQSIYNALPQNSLPTDLGSFTSMSISSSIARAIGLLDPTAQPTDLASQIAFNSQIVPYDFDPSDGIAGGTDFEAVATHEIGHALGFTSRAGVTGTTRAAVWDLFRFRSGTTAATFSTAQRIMTIGGPTPNSQYYFAPGFSELGLSDGGPDGSKDNNADGNQSSHWRQASKNNFVFIGIMDPRIPANTRRQIMPNDIDALNLLGYNGTLIAPTPPPNDNFASAQVISGCSGSVTGTNVGATREAGEPIHSPDAKISNRSVWYQWQAPVTGTARIDTTGSGFDTVLAVYTGSSFGSPLVPIGKDDDGGPLKTSIVEFPASGGTIYRIAVDGYNNSGDGGDIGPITLNWSVANCGSSSVQFSVANYSVGEGANFLNVDVNRSGDASGPATVNYATSDVAGLTNCTVANGNASERCDYGTTVGTLRFAAGETSKSLIIPIVNDALVEGNETFTLRLSGPTGSTLGALQTATVTIVDNDGGGAQNPIDGVNFFVTQQYIDFLGRLPDSTGLANWTATLGNCPNGGFGEFDHPECDRVHVSAGFFLSPEFQGRGYFAYRFYEVALDRRPTYAEFVPDMAQVGGAQSPESEALSKTAYTDAWTQRAEFKSRYDGLSNSVYVNTLEANAEVAISNKATLVNALDTGTMTRGQVLRNIVENTDVANRFFNRAFVAMQYFGYLRRDPDAVGFQNWLTTLNNNPADFRHMIFGFLFSTEYRQRFGP